MTLEEQVWESLKGVIDPELGIDVVNLGLVYEVNVDDENNVFVKMTLTTPGCPLHDSIVNGAKSMILYLDEVNDVDVQLIWEPAWSPDRMSREARESLAF
ncbi:metal-sulfur cluster assembly factor [Bacillaceae bacterium S4-13-58]